jgi:hypothetical protein
LSTFSVDTPFLSVGLWELSTFSVDTPFLSVGLWELSTFTVDTLMEKLTRLIFVIGIAVIIAIVVHSHVTILAS